MTNSRDPVPISASLDGVVRSLRGPSRRAVSGLFGRWGEAVGTDYFLLRLRHAHSGGPPHKDIMRAIERFGRDVIPHHA